MSIACVASAVDANQHLARMLITSSINGLRPHVCPSRPATATRAAPIPVCGEVLWRDNEDSLPGSARGAGRPFDDRAAGPAIPWPYMALRLVDKHNWCLPLCCWRRETARATRGVLLGVAHSHAISAWRRGARQERGRTGGPRSDRCHQKSGRQARFNAQAVL